MEPGGPEKNVLRGYYSERARSYDVEHSRNWEDFSSFRTDLISWCQAGVKAMRNPAGPIADIGAGTGRTLSTISRRIQGPTLAIDISRPMLARIRRTVAGKVEADAHNLPLRSGAIELVYLISVLQYLDLGRAIEELGRVARVGGIGVLGAICVHPHDIDDWRDRAFRDVRQRALRTFRKAFVVRTVLEQYGFSIEGEHTLTFRRNFAEMRVDRQKVGDVDTVELAARIAASAATNLREIYEIDELSFTQYYNLFLVRKL